MSEEANATPEPGTPEHAASMAKRGEEVTITSGEAHSSTSEVSSSPDVGDPSSESVGRPEHVPEKFWDSEKGEVNQDALLAAYATLESSRQASDGDSDGTADGEGDVSDKSDASDDSDSDGDIPDSVINKAQSEFDSSGELSAETYQSLEEAGVDKATVDQYIAGIQASQLLAHTAAGGEDQYNAMIQWAGANLTEAEVAEYDQAVASSPQGIVTAVEGLKARFQSERTVEPNLVEGQRRAAATDGFKSSAEMQAAMADPRYKIDPAFRDDVARRIAIAPPTANLYG